jgi:hypothetical protein
MNPTVFFVLIPDCKALGFVILNHATSANLIFKRHDVGLPVTLNHSANMTSHSCCVHITLVLWTHSAQFSIFTLLGKEKQQLFLMQRVGPKRGSSDMSDGSAGTHV